MGLRALPSLPELGALQTGQGTVIFLAFRGDRGRALAHRAPFFTPWISVAGAAVEGAGLTHLWEGGRADTVGEEASKKTFEKRR